MLFFLAFILEGSVIEKIFVFWFVADLAAVCMLGSVHCAPFMKQSFSGLGAWHRGRENYY